MENAPPPQVYVRLWDMRSASRIGESEIHVIQTHFGKSLVEEAGCRVHGL